MTSAAQASRDLANWTRLQEMQENFQSNTKLEELELMALIDRGTGLSNSRTFLREYAREFARARRLKSNLSMCMIHITLSQTLRAQNSFTTSGDILKSLAAVIQSALRETDVAGRYEKDCFAVVLPDCDLQGAITFAERIRKGLNVQIRSRQNAWDVLIKISVATCSPVAMEKEMLIAKAANALALSKTDDTEILIAH